MSTATAEPTRADLFSGKIVLRKAAVAQAFEVTPATIDNWIRAGAFPKGVRIGGRPYWEADTLRAFLAARLAEGRGGAA